MARLPAAVLAALLLVLVVPAEAHARPAPERTTITVVDTTAAMPAAQAAAAWSKNTDVTLTVAPSCGVERCFTIQWNDGQCSGYSGLSPVGGCAGGDPCEVYVTRGFPQYALRVVTHELGHCLGLDHNTTDARSIMQPSPTVDRPDAGDRAAVRAIW